MAQLRAEFSADARGYEEAILSAAKSLDELPKAAAKAQLRLQEIAAKGSADATKLRETQVLQELQAIEGLTKKAPALYEQAEKAKTEIVQRYAKERIAASTQAAEAETKGFAALREGAEKAHHGLREALMFSNALGESFGVGKSELGKFAKEAIGVFGSGSLFAGAFAGAAVLVSTLVDKFEALRDAIHDARTAATAASRTGTDSIVDRAKKDAEDAEKRIAKANGINIEDPAHSKDLIDDAETNLQTVQGRLTVARLAATATRTYGAGAKDANQIYDASAAALKDPRLLASLISSSGEVTSPYSFAGRKMLEGQAAQVPGLEDEVRRAEAAVDAANLAASKVGAAVAAEAEKKAGSTAVRGARMASGKDPAGPKITDLGGGLTEMDYGLSDIMAGNEQEQRMQQKIDSQDSTDAQSKADLQKQMTAELAKRQKELEAQAIKDAAKEETVVKQGEQTATNFFAGFRKIADKKGASPQDVFGLFWNTLTSILAFIPGFAPAAAGAKAVGSALGFREGGGGWDIPQGREGYGPGVNYDARLSYFRHPAEFTWSAAGVDGAGGPDGVRALHAAAREGRLQVGSGGGGGNVTLVLPTFLPQHAAEAVRQVVTPGVTELLSNNQSAAFRSALQGAVAAPRYR